MRLESDRGRFLVVLALLALCTAIGFALGAFPPHRSPHRSSHHAAGRAAALRVPSSS
jgi:hypothetical protein